jgi:hypothetical protein
MPITVAGNVPPGTYALSMSNAVISNSAFNNIYSGHKNGLFTVTTVPEPKVISPSDSGIEWTSGKTYHIYWNDFTGANVKIELIKGTTVRATIASSSPNTGSFTWTISTGLEPGNDYKIRVTSTDNSSIIDDSDN